MPENKNPITSIQRMASASLTDKSFIFLAAFLLLALFFELSAYLQLPVLGWLAPRMWLSAALVIFLSIAVKGLLRLYKDIRQKRLGLLFVFLCVAGLLLWPVLDRSRSVIGQDATQQLAAGLAAFNEFDWRFTGRAFLDYPSRQYLLAALPALLLGRTETALQIGFAWPFWLSLILFADSLRSWAKEKGLAYGDELSMAAVTAVFAFPYVTEYYLYFEHTLFPCCFALQAIGWLLHFMRRPTLFHALALAWTGTMLIYCYTTALAVVLLLILMLFLFAWTALLTRKRQTITTGAGTVNPTGNACFDWSCLAIASAIALTLLLSMVFGRGDRVTVLRSRDITELVQASLDGLKIALLHQPAVYASIYLPVVWLYLAAALTFLLGRYHAVLAAWTVAVIVMSQVLQGYAVYPAPISFSRTLVTVPVLLTAWFVLLAEKPRTGRLYNRLQAWFHTGRLRQLNCRMATQILLAVLIALNLMVGFRHFEKPMVQGDAAKYFYPAHLQQMQLLISDVNQRTRLETLTEHDSFTFVVYTENVWLMNPGDYTGYFFPLARPVVLASGAPLPDDLDWQQPILIYIIDGSPGDLPATAGPIEHVTLQLSPEKSISLQRVMIRPD